MRTLLILILLAGTASAQTDEAELDAAIRRAAKATITRARRAIAFGPTAGLWAGRAPSPGVNEEAITFGIALETFKVPILPTGDSTKELVIARAKEILRTRAVGQQDVERVAREAWDEAVAEVLGTREREPHTFERPAFNIGLEFNRTFESDAWLPRLRVGLGVWKLTVGASFSVALGTGAEKTPVFTGLELVGHAVIRPKARASVVDVFLRGHFELRNRDTNTDMVVVGVRYLLDLI